MLLRGAVLFILMVSIKVELYGAVTSKAITLTKTKSKMADYKKLIPIIKQWEGGYVNHPLDKGGCTNSGVTISTYRSYYGKNQTCDNLKKMTDYQWEVIFKNSYWNRWLADKINSQAIANLVVDWVWGSGVWGIKYPQQVLGVVADGIVGKKTLAAINDYPNQKELFLKLWNRRKAHFEAIVKRNPSQKVFLKGWMNRLNSFKWYEG